MTVFITNGDNSQDQTQAKAIYRHNRIATKGGTWIPSARIDEMLIPVAPGVLAETMADGTKPDGQYSENYKMGFCDLNRDNVLTHVAANEHLHSTHLNVRRHAEYMQTSDGKIYFVNKKGQIGVIGVSLGGENTINWLLNAPNYYSWCAGVEPDSNFESVSIPCDKYIGTGTLYDRGNDSIKHSHGNDVVSNFRGSYALKRPFGTVLKQSRNGLREVSVVGFQIDDNECAIFVDGEPIYYREYDGRRFPVAYNYRDGMFVDFRHPDRDGSGVCQSLWAVPALDNRGKIVWAMPPSPVVYDPAKSYDGTMVNEGRHPSPVPVLNAIPLNLSLVWHWWTAYSPMSIVKGGLSDHPHTEPGYYATGYKRYFSFCLQRQGRCPPEIGDGLLEGGCTRYDFTGSYFGDLDASESTFRGVRTQGQIDSTVPLKVSDVTPLCIDDGLWLMTPVEQTTGVNCPDPPLVDVPRQDDSCSKEAPQPCGKYRESMAVRVSCRHYDFPPDVPLHNQIRGFVCEVVPDGYIRIKTRQNLFTCIQESRRVTKENEPIIGEPPKPLPLNWSLVDEINSDNLSYEVFTALAHNERNRPIWWQKYIETFYLCQSQPLSAHLVQIFDNKQILIPENCDYYIDPLSGNRVITKCYDENGNELASSYAPSNTPDGWKTYGQPDFGFFDYVNDVGQRQFMQITMADTYKPGCYIPLWMHFKKCEPKITAQRDVVSQESIEEGVEENVERSIDDKNICHPLPWYTFRFDKLEDSENEEKHYYTTVINRHVRGSSIPTSIPHGIHSDGKELAYSTFEKDVTIPQKGINGEYVLDEKNNVVLDIEMKTMSVLEVPAVSSDFTGDSDFNAIYGLVSYDVVGVAKLSGKPPSNSEWYMYDGAQMVYGGNNYQEYLDYSRREHKRVIYV